MAGEELGVEPEHLIRRGIPVDWDEQRLRLLTSRDWPPPTPKATVIPPESGHSDWA